MVDLVYLIISNAIIFISAGILLYFSVKSKNSKVTELNNMLSEHKDKIQCNQEQLSQINNNLAIYQTKFENAENSLNELKNRNNFLEEENKSLMDKNSDFKKQLACQIQENQYIIEKHKTFEEATKETIAKANESAKSAVFEVGANLSKQLIEQTRRESAENSKNSQKLVEKTTEELNSRFEKMSHFVSQIGKQVEQSGKMVDVIKQSMLSPNLVGGMSEITLENILKSSGLLKNKDFFMQFSINENSSNDKILRPDAVVMLPGDAAMIIDSKSSKFFFEIFHEQADNEEILSEKLKNSMRFHLKSLSAKSYAGSVQEHFKKKQQKINNISTLMFLQTDAALERISKIDPNFIFDAWDMGIYPVGPTGLISILSHAKFQISEKAQIENYEHIIVEIRKMMSSIHQLYSHASKIGSSLKSAANHYNKFAASFNRNFISKISNLKKFGVEGDKTKKIEENPLLEKYELISSKDVTIEYDLIDNKEEA